MKIKIAAAMGVRAGMALAVLEAWSACLPDCRAEAQAEWPEPHFAPPPRLAISGEELAARKASPEIEKLRAASLKEADPLLETPPELPDGPASWVFYYANPENGNQLVPLSAKEHKDPATGKIFTDERTCAAYRALVHYRAENAARTLGWAYAYTGDDRYAEGVRRILRKLADDYPGYPQRVDRWGRKGWFAPLGGRRFVQSLDEAHGIIQLAKGYDLTRNSPVFSKKDREVIEENLFRGTAETLLCFNQGISNHQTWYNAGLMAIASVLEDGALARKVLTMRGGYLYQLAHSVGEDGLWCEGTMAYHNYALQAMIEIVEAGRRIGWPLEKQEKFRLLFTAPLHAVYPNGIFPAINDSDRANLAMFDGAWRWAWETWKAPVFAQALARGDVAKLRTLLGPEAAVEWPPGFRSEVLPAAGLAVLREGVGENATCVFVDYGPHGGGHGHFDKLNLLLYAVGREWLLDPGRLTYSHKEYGTWVKTTAAHNTVTIDGRSQVPATGQLLYLEQGDGFSTAGVACDTAYTGVHLERHVLLAGEFLVDVFDVRSDKPRQVDLFMHVASARFSPAGAAAKVGDEAAGNQDGYQHLSEVERWNSAADLRWDFEGEGRILRVHFPGEVEEQLFAGKSIGYSLQERVPTLIRRRKAAQTRFVAVYDLTGKGAGVQRVTAAGDASWIVATSRGKFHIRMDKNGRLGFQTAQTVSASP